MLEILCRSFKLSGKRIEKWQRSLILKQIRNTLRYVASKNHKAFMVNLKRVYRAKSLGEAEAALDELESLWGEKYPIVITSWRTKWEHLSAYFKCPKDIRRFIYTTNSIEVVHR